MRNRITSASIDVSRFCRAIALAVAVAVATPIEGRAGEEKVEGNAPANRASVAEVRQSYARVEEVEGGSLGSMIGKAADRDARIRAVAEVRRRFVDTLARAPWEEMDPDSDATLLRRGLTWLAESAERAGDGPLEARAWSGLTKLLPEDKASREVASWKLPRSRLRAGDVRGAIADWERAAKADDLTATIAAAIGLGDLHYALGDDDAAKSRWGQIAQFAPYMARDCRVHERSRLEMKGTPAPEIPRGDWAGSEPRRWADFRGRAVLVHIFSTWSEVDRAAIVSVLRALRGFDEHRVAVLGIVARSPHGFLPHAGAKDIVTEGTSLSEIRAQDFAAHVRLFRERASIPYPIVAVAEESADAFHPLVDGKRVVDARFLVIDADGRVAFTIDGALGPELWPLAMRRVLESSK